VTQYVGFDLETTGVSSFFDAPVSYGFVERRVTEGVEVLRESGFVNPGVAIPRGASAIHGISDEMVADATPLREATMFIADRISGIWAAGGVVVGMNVGYDLTMVESLCSRMDLPTLSDRGVGPVMDILVIDRHFDRWRKGARKLGDLARTYGVEQNGAHSAIEDAEVSLAIFDVMLERYPEIGSMAPGEVNATLRAWYQEWLTSFSQYLERRGEAPINSGRYEWPIHADG
jgi:DNA polymerase III subunit epsilon